MARKTKEEAEQTRADIISAARRMFHRFGVARTNLDMIARDSGVTRGAVYHHFKNKSELFFAMRECIVLPLFDSVGALVEQNSKQDPLKAMHQGLMALFRTIQEDQAIREMFEIMVLRCEYVDEFVDILNIKVACSEEFICQHESDYKLALEMGLLTKTLSPRALAEDTFLFVHGLLNFWLASGGPDRPLAEVEARIAAHLALRRAS